MIGFSLRAMATQPVPEHRVRFFLLGVRAPNVEDYFGVATVGYWGMTETVTQGTIADFDHLGPPMNIGKCAAEYQIQVRREDGTLCGPGELGHLYIRGVRGVSLFKEYYRDPEATESSFDADGWLETGDVVRSDENGWLYFSD
ncbi:MAG: ATP-dependent acyl-CoA ligase, partial [Gammaproteobacteria bacterium]|nr:ATP-dependent acyl-CoA ligase [Gammaproteobacteria bacterium]